MRSGNRVQFLNQPSTSTPKTKIVSQIPEKTHQIGAPNLGHPLVVVEKLATQKTAPLAQKDKFLTYKNNVEELKKKTDKKITEKQKIKLQRKNRDKLRLVAPKPKQLNKNSSRPIEPKVSTPSSIESKQSLVIPLKEPKYANSTQGIGLVEMDAMEEVMKLRRERVKKVCGTYGYGPLAKISSPKLVKMSPTPNYDVFYFDR